LDLDDQYPVVLEEQEDAETHVSEAAAIGDSSHHRHHHQTLKGSCPMRWNSVLSMLESISDRSKSVELKIMREAVLCKILSSR